MRKNVKAALLSAFVFPGLGHVILKKYVTGALLAGGTFISLFYLIANAVQRTLLLSEKINSGEIQLDAAAIGEVLSVQTTGTEAVLSNIATVVLIGCWLFGIGHSFKAGREMDEATSDGA